MRVGIFTFGHIGVEEEENGEEKEEKGGEDAKQESN